MEQATRSISGPLETRLEPSGPWLIALAVVLVYGRCVGFPFVNWDDVHFILENPRVHSLSLANVQAVFQPGGVPREMLYIPLTHLSHMLEAAVLGLKPAVVHTLNLLLHLANALLAFQLLRQWSRDAAIATLGALAFAIHPLQVETVVWAMGRKDLLATLFGLLALLAYGRFLARNDRTWLGATMACFVLGLLAKPTLIVLPLLLVLLDTYLTGSPAARHWGNKIPFVLVALLAYWINDHMPKQEPDLMPAVVVRLLALPWLAFEWLRRLLLFGEPVPFYSWPPPDTGPRLLLLGGLGIFALLSVLLIGWRFNLRYVWFGIGFWLIGLAPMGLLVLRPRDFVTADRYGYLPMLGIAFAAAAAVRRVRPEWRRKYTAVFCVWLVVSAFLSFLQTGVWSSSERLWTRVLNHYPQNVIARNNLGLAYVEQDRLDLAEQQFRAGLAIDPTYATLYTNLGTLLRDRGQLDAAVEVYRRSLAIAPNQADTYRQLGEALDALKEYAAAANAFARAVDLRPDDSVALNALGGYALEAGRLSRAIDYFQRALPTSNNPARILYNLGLTYERQGTIELASRHYEAAVRHKPDFTEAWYNLGTVLLRLDRYPEAERALRQGIADPPTAEACINLAQSLTAQGRDQEALPQLRLALEIGTPHAPIVHFLIGQLHERQGRPREARTAYTAAIELAPTFEPAQTALKALK